MPIYITLELRDLITSAVNSAFNMAQGALNEIDGDRSNEDVRNVIKWLFLQDGDDPYTYPLHNVHGKFD